MKVTMTAAAMMVAAGVYASTTNYWTGAVNDYDWTEPGNYLDLNSHVPAAAPVAGDTVILTHKTVARLLFADAGSRALFNSFRAVSGPQGSSGGRDEYSELLIDVPAGETMRITCGLCAWPQGGNYAGGWDRIKVTKSGPGRLELDGETARIVGNLANLNYCTDYFACWNVTEGVLRYPTNYVNSRSYGHHGRLLLADGATVALGLGGADGDVFSTSSISGIITNEFPAVRILRLDGSLHSVYGKITGMIDYLSRGHATIYGVDNDFSGDFAVQYRKTAAVDSESSAGFAAITRFGNLGERSSIGTNASPAIKSEGGYIKYVGEGESTDRDFISGLSLTAGYYAHWSGGDHGGLVVNGKFRCNGVTPASYTCYLSGDGTTPCELRGGIVDGSAEDPGTFQFIKFGTGAWNFYNSANTTWSGSLWVKNGSIGFESIAEQGVQSALGDADHLYEPLTVKYDEANPSGYAIKLGDGATRGAIEYLGATNCVSNTRAVKIAGEGAILHNGADGYLQISGISPDGADAATLVLGGANANEKNLVDDLSGALSVVKEGAGTWRIGKNAPITGDIHVKGGRLVYGVFPASSSAWRYFRFTVKSTFWPTGDFTETSGTAKRKVGICHFALFDEDGTELTAGLTTPEDLWRENTSYSTPGAQYYTNPWEVEVAPSGVYGSNAIVTNAINLGEGEFAMRNDHGQQLYHGGMAGWQGLFTRTLTAAWSVDARTPGYCPDEGHPDRWLVITMRPNAGSKPVTSWDVVTAGSNSKQSYQMISNCCFEASMNGVDWTTLTEFVRPYDEVAANTWISDGSAYDRDYTSHTGFAIPMGPAVDRTLDFRAASVQVDAGASLTVESTSAVSVPKLVVSANGGGAVSGLALAENGVIDIVDAPRGAFDIGVDLSGVTLPAAYSFTLNGSSAMAGRSISIAADRRTIKVVAPGTQIFFR